jgi:hypothetical protein
VRLRVCDVCDARVRAHVLLTVICAPLFTAHMFRSRKAARTVTDGVDSDDSTGSTLDDGGHDDVLGAVGVALDELGATQADDTPMASIAAATHSVVSTDDDAVLVAGDSDDASDARAQLRAIVDGMISEQLDNSDTPAAPAAAAGTPRAAASPHAETPDGKLVSIQQLVAQCNHLRVGEKPSKDRLTRVTQVDASQRTCVQVSSARKSMCTHTLAPPLQRCCTTRGVRD